MPVHFLFVLLISSIIYMHFSTWKENSTVKKKALLIVLTVFLLLVVLMKLIALIEKDFDVLVAFLISYSTCSNACKTINK